MKIQLSEISELFTLAEEKNLGTAHFGSGGNLSYGNREGPHFDAVIEKPTVYFDSKIIIENGRLNDKFIKLNHF